MTVEMHMGIIIDNLKFNQNFYFINYWKLMNY